MTPIISYNMQLEVLTPLHVGGATEKKLKNGIDFTINKQGIELLKWNEILNALGDDEIETVCNALVQRNYNVFSQLANKKSAKVFLHGISGSPTDIKTFIRNGMNVPYLPGSSVKGALSSILLNYLMDKNFKRKNNPNPPKDIEKITLGEFSDRITRFIGITDASVNDTNMNYFLTKIFSLRKENDQWIAGWKNAKNGSDSNFKEDKFVTAYECIKPNTSLSFRLNIYEGLADLFKSHFDKKMNPLEQVKKNANEDWLTNLFSIINQYSREYIEKEIAYFNTYKVKDTNSIIQSLENIKKQIPSDNSFCVFRMASGSGFYSITGDWQFKDHVWTIYNLPYKKQKKTRRLIFEKRGNNYIFYPMGFVKLMLSSDKNNNTTHHKETSTPSPVYYTGKLKEGIIVQGICIGQDEKKPAIKKIKLFVGNPQNETVLPVLYFADLSPQRLLKLQVTNVKDNKIISVQFIGFVN
jgi:CRISPR/Cas system CSM-associated protein Csm5 (group 7 of RAMP superfamily)